MIDRLKELFEYKELIINLTVKELKLKYRNSTLGFIWSFLNPLLMLVVYTFAFSFILKVKIPNTNFTVFLLAGLLPWTFFQTAVQMSTSSIVSNANLIKKVYFPREIIPLTIIFSNFVNFLITLLVLFASVALFKVKVGFSLIMLPISLILLLFFVIGVSLILSSLNVLYRDVSHLVEVAFMAWFYVTPIIYSLTMIPAKYRLILMLNPMTLIVESIRASMVYDTWPKASYVLCIVLVDLVLLFIGYKVFTKLEKRFAEEI